MGGDWVVAFAVYDREDRDIFRKVLGLTPSSRSKIASALYEEIIIFNALLLWFFLFLLLLCCNNKGRVPLPNRMNCWKSSKGEGSFSIQKIMLQILGILNRAF